MMKNSKGLKLFSLAACLCVGLLSNAQKKKIKVTEKEPAPVSREQKMKEIEITKEMDAPANATVRILCANQNVEIRRSTNGKVKLSKKIEVDNSNNQSNDELLEKYGITMHGLNNRIDITAKDNGVNNFFFKGPADFQKIGKDFHVNGFSFSNEHGINDPQVYQFKKQQSELARDQSRLLQDERKMKIDQRILIEKLNRSGLKEKIRDQNKEKVFNDQDLRSLQELKSMDYMKLWADSIKIMMPRIELMPKINNQIREGIKIAGEMHMGNDFNFNFNMHMGNKSSLVVYVPANVKLDLENQYGNINIADDYKDVSINLNNGSLDTRNIGTLKLIAKFATVNMGDVEDAEIEFENGNFTASNIKDLDVDSKSSTMEFDNCENIILRSQNDNYTVESVGKLEGRKSYGSFRLNKLNKSFNLDGQNADLRIKNMDAGVEMVKLKDRYADVRLPVKNLQNYSVNFSGNYSSVYGPFEKHIVDQPASAEEGDKSPITISRDNGQVFVNGVQRFKTSSSENSPNFNASVGDKTGRQTTFDIKCTNCTIDFK